MRLLFIAVGLLNLAVGILYIFLTLRHGLVDGYFVIVDTYMAFIQNHQPGLARFMEAADPALDKDGRGFAVAFFSIINCLLGLIMIVCGIAFLVSNPPDQSLAIFLIVPVTVLVWAILLRFLSRRSASKSQQDSDDTNQ